MAKTGYVYILSSGFKHLYIGVTSNLECRIWQHQNGSYASASPRTQPGTTSASDGANP